MSHGSIAPAIALRQPEPETDKYSGDHSIEAVVARIHFQLDHMLQYESTARGSWLVEQVVEHFRPKPMSEADVALGDVSWLLWEEINAGRINIDKYGGLTRGTTAAV